MAYYFAPIAEGLGDLLLTLPALRCLIKTGRPTYLVVRSPKQSGVAESIPGLAGWLEEPDFLMLELNADDRFINLRDHPMYTENVFGADTFVEKFGRITIIDVFERIAKDVIDENIWSGHDLRQSEPFAFQNVSSAENHVLLVPGSAGAFKCWTTANWIAVYKALNELGIQSAVVGEPEKCAEVQALLDMGLKWIPTPTFQAAIDVVSSARAIIGVDTGILHLAVQQGIQVIGLYMQRSIFVRPEKNCFPIFAPDCGPNCLGWIYSPPPTNVTFSKFELYKFAPCSEAEGERCMDFITVDTVMNAFKSRLI
jgi:Glycosyltransferase family 9 (heptosyltransferase)